MNGACEMKASNGSGGRELKVLGAFTAVFVFLFLLPGGIVMAKLTKLLYGALF